MRLSSLVLQNYPPITLQNCPGEVGGFIVMYISLLCAHKHAVIGEQSK